MLEFLVLGNIPGTSVQLDFLSVLLLTMLVALLITAYIHVKSIARRANELAQKYLNIELISL